MPDPRKAFPLRIEPALWDQLERCAAAEFRSVNAQIELSLREALALKHRHIADGHIALGLLREGGGLAMKVLHDRGVDPGELRRDLTAALLS